MGEYPSLWKERAREVPSDLKGTMILVGPEVQHVEGFVALDKSLHLCQPGLKFSLL